MTITTTATTTSALERPRIFYVVWLPLGGLGLTGIVMIGPRRKRRPATLSVAALWLTLLLLALSGCGGGHTPVTIPGTPKGTSTITVTATSPDTTHTSTFTLTVN